VPLIDAFLCRREGKPTLGVEIMPKMSGNLLDLLLMDAPLQWPVDSDEMTLESLLNVNIRDQLTQILNQLHRCRILHRDLVPGNFLYTGEPTNPTIYISDFEQSIYKDEATDSLERIPFVRLASAEEGSALPEMLTSLNKLVSLRRAYEEENTNKVNKILQDFKRFDEEDELLWAKKYFSL
jgi:serine/threonine protein kinase